MFELRTISFLAATLLAASPAVAQPYAPGDPVTPFSLEDQHGTMQSVEESTRVILFSRDMDGGDVLEEALSDVDADAITSRDALYVSDISGMPGLVAKLFAIPSMRKRGYPMALDRDGQATARLPDVAGEATLVFLENLVVSRVVYCATPERVRDALGLAQASD